MLRLRLVKESRIIQTSGKMLIASNSAIVGVTNSQAMVRSDSPRTRRTGRDLAGSLAPGNVACSDCTIVVILSIGLACQAPPRHRSGEPVGGASVPPLLRGDLLALFLEDLGPVLDEKIERLLRRTLVGNDVVMHALLHVEQQLRV